MIIIYSISKKGPSVLSTFFYDLSDGISFQENASRSGAGAISTRPPVIGGLDIDSNMKDNQIQYIYIQYGVCIGPSWLDLIVIISSVKQEQSLAGFG